MGLFGLTRYDFNYLICELGWLRLRLLQKSDPEIEAFFRAFKAVRKQELSPEEAESFGKVEQLRLELTRSTKPIVYYDHGADARDTPLEESLYVDGRNMRTTVGHLPALKGKWALVLFRLIRELRPRSCLEMGTCTGISALFQAMAQRCNGSGRLVTLDGNEVFVELARQNCDRLSVDTVEIVSGEFEDTLPRVLEQCAPIDFVYIDGDHHEDTTVSYYDQIDPYLAEGAAVVFDDIRWASGMYRAWQRIIRRPTVLRSFDLDRLGVCLYSSRAESHKHYRVRI